MYALCGEYPQTSCSWYSDEVCEEEVTKNDETIPQKLAVVDPKRVLAGGAAALVILILLIYLIVRRKDKKRRMKQLSERKEEAESDEK